MTECIFQYTRAQAIDDGVLVDVSRMAREAGITVPVAVTHSVWAEFVEVPDELAGEQDETGRLWDILTMFRLKAKSTSKHWLKFQVLVKKETQQPPETVTLKAHCGPGDDIKPVITIMQLNED